MVPLFKRKLMLLGMHSTAPLTSDGGAEQERSSAALGSV